ncbi:hypothetical protein EpsU [Oenococcus oeni ATCC BAA-1163]|uniref:Polysaccharide polymerase n=1 Tax=Oenococcus oeni ATCC BAA-1163 TaxID=379360 RepID=A0NKE9_OENOE|nr:hypothetical protein [Oenococcus oeni]EAV39002.1 hypothetical protein EpsU [Oenococcus oeni ATCC BAA-1163]KDP19784.1 hypothetical protein EL27_04215 [Oenococcus oeni]
MYYSNKIIKLLIVFYFILVGFLSSNMSYIIGLVLLSFLLLHFKFAFPRKILFIPYWPILFYLILIGLLNQPSGPSGFIYFLKNLINFTNPIIFLSIGALFTRLINKVNMIKLILDVALVVSLFHIIYLFLNISAFDSFNELRSTTGLQIDIVPLALIFVLFRKKFGLTIKFKRLIFDEIVFFSILLMTFSRTMIIIFVLYAFVAIASVGSKKRFFKLMKFFLFILTIFALFYLMVPDDIKTTFFGKILNSFKEVNSNNAWSNSTDVTTDWRGFENYTASSQFNSFPLLNKLFGGGLTDSVFVGGYSVLVGVSNGYLPFLHNGYYTLLLKGGVLVLLYYIVFIIGNSLVFMFSKKYNQDSFASIPLSILLGFFVTTYFTMGPFIKGASVWLLILLGYFSYLLKNSKKTIANKELEQ